VSAFIVCIALERTIGLRVSEETEIAGIDRGYWGTAGYSDVE
jgi:ammonia channel protein AmtB